MSARFLPFHARCGWRRPLLGIASPLMGTARARGSSSMKLSPQAQPKEGAVATLANGNRNRFSYCPQSEFRNQNSSEISRSRPDSEEIGWKGTRVLYMVDSLNVGGTETQMVHAACRLHARHYQVTVGCLRARGPLREILRRAGIAVVEFPPQGTLLSLSGIYQLLRLARFVRRRRFQIVHSHDLWSNLMCVPASWLARAPVIISSRRDLAHLAWYRRWGTRVVRLVHQLSTVIVVNSAAVREFLVKEHRFPSDAIRVIHNGVDFERFARARGDRRVLFPDLDGHHKLVAVLANMRNAVKGHAYLVEAARAICRAVPETKFLLIGEGEERPKVEKLVHEMGLTQNFVFLGYREDIPELLNCCDLSILPSVAEGLPNAVLEAMASGLPIVATRAGGTAEIIEDGISGLLVPPRDPEALAQAALRLLQDIDFAKKLARAGQQRVQTQFSFDRLFWKLDLLYTELLKRT